jgi:hypothetical protein
MRSLRRNRPSPPTDVSGPPVEPAGPADPLERITWLTERNRTTPDPATEEALVRARYDAFPALVGPGPGLDDLVADPGDPGPLEAIDRDQLSTAAVRAGLARHGCLHVQGMFDAEVVAELVAGIDRAIEAFDAGLAGAPPADTTPWYSPFVPDPPHQVVGRANWVRASGGVLTADSPRMLFRICELLRSSGVGDLVGEYFGERPALSVTKNTLRRVSPDADTNWHQDGAFLGADVRSLNMWVALTDCGDDAPGLDIVPRRLDEVLASGSGGATFDWSVGHEAAAGSSSVGVVRPRFRAGDVLFFDHLFLHRTAVEPTMTRDRYAIECWLFAPSAYPGGEIPLVY